MPADGMHATGSLEWRFRHSRLGSSTHNLLELFDEGKTAVSIASKSIRKGDDRPPLLMLPTSFAISLLLYWLQRASTHET